MLLDYGGYLITKFKVYFLQYIFFRNYWLLWLNFLKWKLVIQFIRVFNFLKFYLNILLIRLGIFFRKEFITKMNLFIKLFILSFFCLSFLNLLLVFLFIHVFLSHCLLFDKKLVILICYNLQTFGTFLPIISSISPIVFDGFSYCD